MRASIFYILICFNIFLLNGSGLVFGQASGMLSFTIVITDDVVANHDQANLPLFDENSSGVLSGRDDAYTADTLPSLLVNVTSAGLAEPDLLFTETAFMMPIHTYEQLLLCSEENGEIFLDKEMRKSDGVYTVSMEFN